MSWNPPLAAGGWRGAVPPGGWRVTFALVCAVASLLPLVPGRAQAEDEDGVHWKPSVFWKKGDQRLDLALGARYRVEWWDAHEGRTDTFHTLRTRVAAKYSVGDRVTIFGEFQDARIYDLSDDSSGAGALYRKFSHGAASANTEGQDLRQIWAELRPIEGLSIRGGRTDIELGTQAMYPEPNWRYLKVKRASQRLVGTVGWSLGERSNDGGTLAYDTEGYHLYLFGANPTTGVFDISNGYEHQGDIVYGGISLTAKRGTWLPDTEVRGFFLGYGDDRPPSDGGKLGGVEVYTVGFSAIGVHPCGPGNLDLFVWAAGQAGDFDGRDHLAGAGIVELGYQLPGVFAKPWLRAGVNVASGGGASGDHHTFFNMLPTNHLYYGFADQLAFQNLLDIIGQVKLEPHEKVGIDLMVHHFRLVDSDDGRYFGTGAFTRKDRPGNFGFGSGPSGGRHEVGTELDVVVDVKLRKGVSLQGGYSHLWDGGVFELDFPGAAGVEFGYLQLSLRH